jgi:hypothetical protein
MVFASLPSVVWQNSGLAKQWSGKTVVWQKDSAIPIILPQTRFF